MSDDATFVRGDIIIFFDGLQITDIIKRQSGRVSLGSACKFSDRLTEKIVSCNNKKILVKDVFLF